MMGATANLPVNSSAFGNNGVGLGPMGSARGPENVNSTPIVTNPYDLPLPVANPLVQQQMNRML
jgi:hypothetical protein